MSQLTIFDRILDGEIPCHRVHEDDHVLAFLDIGPLSRGHLLVIPKERKATLDQLSDESAAALGRVLPRLCRAVLAASGATAFNVLQNNGSMAPPGRPSRPLPHHPPLPGCRPGDRLAGRTPRRRSRAGAGHRPASRPRLGRGLSRIASTTPFPPSISSMRSPPLLPFLVLVALGACGSPGSDGPTAAEEPAAPSAEAPEPTPDGATFTGDVAPGPAAAGLVAFLETHVGAIVHLDLRLRDVEGEPHAVPAQFWLRPLCPDAAESQRSCADSHVTVEGAPERVETDPETGVVSWQGVFGVEKPEDRSDTLVSWRLVSNPIRRNEAGITVGPMSPAAEPTEEVEGTGDEPG